ncbi:MAG: hypothetical protein ACRD3P_18185 [Terriglobales bacterium]
MRRVHRALGTFVVLIAVLMPLQRSLPREVWVILLAAGLSYGTWLIEARPAGNDEETSRRRKQGSKLVMLLSLAGLSSGVLTAALCDGSFSSDLGIPFAAITAFCFAISYMVRSMCRLLCFFALVACTFGISVFSAEISDFLFSGRERYHPTSLFMGGMVGGFIILGGAFILFRPKTSISGTAREAFFWSVLPGILSPVAWALGPSLGIWIWSALHAVGLTTPANTLSSATPADTLSNALYGETGYGPLSRLFALFVVWQAGMGFVLGMALRKASGKAKTSSWEELKLT